MIHRFDQWREELRDVDAELVSLIQRRVELAIGLLELLRTGELTLGDLEMDTVRLGVLLSTECEADTPLDEAALKKIFRRIINETKRLAASEYPGRRGAQQNSKTDLNGKF